MMFHSLSCAGKNFSLNYPNLPHCIIFNVTSLSIVSLLISCPINVSFDSSLDFCVGVLTRGSGSQLVNTACFLVPDDDARGNTVTHGLSWFRPRGRTSSKRGCARALYYLAPGVLVVGGTSEAREGEKLPSLC